MNTIRPLVLSLLVLGLTTPAVADTHPEAPRVFVNVSGLFQSSSQTLTQTVTFTRNLEEGHFDVRRPVRGGGVIDVGGAYRIRRQLGAGIAFTSLSTRGTDGVTGAVPHPLFFDRHRSFAIDATGLGHRQRGVHLHAIWFMPMPVVRKATVRLFAGPSILSVSHAHVAGVDFQEIGPGFGAVDASVTGVNRSSATSAGFNVGADATYMVLNRLFFLRGVGAGLTVRYAGGSVTLSALEGQRQRIDAGGFQVGLGLRVQY